MTRALVFITLTLSTACGSAAQRPSSTAAPEALTPAPWSVAPLPRAAVPGVFRTEWEKAPNRASCAVLAPASLGDGAGGIPRAATFSGGWGVAYDRAGVRSAFGIAGSGSVPDSTTYDAWPNKKRWADGSSVGYGPEGGTGPNQLAYLRVAGQSCLYNVWSRLGVVHLEFLLSQLRFAE